MIARTELACAAVWGLLLISSAPQPSGAAVDPLAASGLQYQWQPDTNYIYRWQVEGEDGDQIHLKSGEVWYSLVGKRQPEPPQEEPGGEPPEGSGTAFVVSSDGYLVTCAHVVEYAAQIDVTLGDQKFEATVIATDQERDLALLKVDAADLPALALRDSEKVELGQEVRALGFPLSTVLGDSIKVTRGSIAGFIKDRDYGHKVFQIDASLNLGNSGGPLVNAMGEAIGINFAKLDVAVANNVGFATPINFVKDLLEEAGVAFQSGSSTTQLAATELVRGVAPTVAFVHVKLTPPMPDEILQLRSRAFFRESIHDKDAARPEPKDLRDYIRGRSPMRIEIDERGNLWSEDSSENLPWLLGTVSDVFFVSLPDRRQLSWEREFQTGITFSISSRTIVPGNRFDRVPRRFGDRGFRGRNPFERDPEPEVRIETATVMIPAIERHVYRIVDQSETTTVIQKDIHFQTLSDEGLRFEMTAQARIVFDRQAGVPQSMKLRGELVGQNDGREEKNPFTLEFSLVTTRPTSEDALGRELVETMQLPMTGDALDQVFAEIDSEDERVAQRALASLIQTPPRDELRSQVARVLVALLNDRDGTIRSQAVDALVLWSSEETVPALIARLNHADRAGRDEVFQALARLQDPRAVEPLAEQLQDLSVRGAAVRALIAMGASLVEDTVARYVSDPDSGIQEAACQVLKAVGTENSVAALRQTLDTTTNDRVARAAYEAIAQIYLRAGTALPENIVAPDSLTKADVPPAAGVPRNLPRLLRIFEDEADFAGKMSHGSGNASLETGDRYSGNAALRVAPVQIYDAQMEALNVVIRQRPGPDEYRYLRFAWKKPNGRKPVGVQVACNGGWQIRYHAGSIRNPWGDSNLVSDQLPTEWEVVTCDLFADYGEFVLTGIALDAFDGDYALFDHVYLARSLDDFQQVDAIVVPAAEPKVQPVPPVPVAPRSDPIDSPATFRIFEDEVSFATALEGGFGGGEARLFNDDKYSGTASLKVTPIQAVNPRMPDMALRIREHPQPGEFRYLRFAWKKPTGEEPIGIQFANHGRWGFRLHAGAGRVRWGGSTRIDPDLPRDWVVVTRDLFADFGEFTMTGVALDAFDGQYALFDHMYLARSLEDLDSAEGER